MSLKSVKDALLQAGRDLAMIKHPGSKEAQTKIREALEALSKDHA